MINQHRRNVPYVRLESPTVGGAIDLSSLCVSVVTNKDTANVAGTFSVTFSDSALAAAGNVGNRMAEVSTVNSVQQFKELTSVFREMDLITIGFSKHGGTMLGVVESISRNETFSSGRYSTNVTVRGRDFGRFLIEDHIPFSPLIGSATISKRNTLAAILGGEDHPVLSNGIRFLYDYRGNPLVFSTVEQLVLYVVLSYSVGMKTFIPGFGRVGTDKLLSEVFLNLPLKITQADGSKGIGPRTLPKNADAYFIQGRPEDQLIFQTPLTYDGNVISYFRRLLTEELYDIWVETIPPIANPEHSSPIWKMQLRGDFPSPVLIVRPKPFDENLMNFTGDKINQEFTWNNHPLFKTQVYRASFNEPIKPGQKDPVSSTGDGRKTPGGTEQRPSQDFHIIEDYISKSIQTSLGGNFNWYEVRNQFYVTGMINQEMNGISFPLIDFASMTIHGLKKMIVETSFFSDLPEDLEDASSLLRDKRKYQSILEPALRRQRNRLFCQNRMNYWFEGGVVVCHGNEDYRIGDKVAIQGHKAHDGTPQDVIFYTEAVENRWSMGTPYTTTLKLSRGHSDLMIEKFIDFISEIAIRSSKIPLNQIPDQQSRKDAILGFIQM